MTVALAIPHAPWVQGRIASLERLKRGLGVPAGLAAQLLECKIFDERAHWSVWSEALWTWGAKRGADHLLQLQDDVIPAPDFWPALFAMLEAVPDQIISLHGGHPAFRSLARDGHRWATSQWMAGVGYVLPSPALRAFLDWRNGQNEGFLYQTHEDDLIGAWCAATDRRVWHPLPTIIDHDTDLASTYGALGNDQHMHRRPTVTWQGYAAHELCDPTWWAVTDDPPVVSNPFTQGCWMCGNEPSAIGFRETGGHIGRNCIRLAANALMGGLK